MTHLEFYVGKNPNFFTYKWTPKQKNLTFLLLFQWSLLSLVTYLWFHAGHVLFFLWYFIWFFHFIKRWSVLDLSTSYLLHVVWKKKLSLNTRWRDQLLCSYNRCKHCLLLGTSVYRRSCIMTAHSSYRLLVSFSSIKPQKVQIGVEFSGFLSDEWMWHCCQDLNVLFVFVLFVFFERGVQVCMVIFYFANMDIIYVLALGHRYPKPVTLWSQWQNCPHIFHAKKYWNPKSSKI